jgi:putative Flp pilus-assembly TadE/G-like protein/putative Tad-like protein involved in Flp pilus assembly
MASECLSFRKRSNRASEAGQAMLFFILILGIFLLGSLCLAFDLSNMWFHRQAAQNAADAACTAGAMDLLVDAQGGATGNQGFTPGTDFDCTSSGNPTASVCQYAAKNGYDSGNGTPGNLVSVSFPTGVVGVSTPPASMAPTPFIRVDVVEHVQTFFLGLLSGSRSADVRAFASCGLELATSPIPILVLDPKNPKVKPASSALDVQGNPTIAIVGGPSKSIQVNSSDAAATNVGGSGTIDLSKAGPNGTGADIGIYGGPATAPSGFIGGSTGHWVSPAAPINDPFAQLAAPADPGGTTPPILTVASTTPGIVCPDTNCAEFQPGSYSSGICIGKSAGCTCIGSSNTCTAIFDPGLYYINGNFKVDSNSCLRPSGAAGDGSGGVIFYFTGGGSVSVDANSGSKCTNPFNTAGYAGTSSLQNGIACTATSVVPDNLKNTTLTGNVLLAPCTGAYGDPLGAADPLGVQHGMLFFQDRSTLSANQSWGGSGSFLLAGTMYFHSCNASGTGTGCGAAGTYLNDIFTLQGGSGSSTYVLGDIIADNIALGGNSTITMDLNPTRAFTILKASLLQ